MLNLISKKGGNLVSIQAKVAMKAEKPQSLKTIRGPLISIIIGMFMVMLDSTAINIAIPILSNEFNSSLSVIQWSVTGYILAEAAIIPIAGWLSDKFGANRIFVISIGLFTFSSILCVFATNAGQFVAFRIMQGLGGGLVMPLSMAMIYRLSPPGKVGAVMGMIGVPSLLAPALGPIVAGWLVNFASWHYIFIINIPVGLIGVILCLKSLPSFERQATAPLDILGILFGPLAFAALVYGVTQGGDSGWDSTNTIIGLAVGVLALLIFIIAELRQQHPLIELRVFRSRVFTISIIVVWISGIAYYGTLFINPVFLQEVKGHNAFEAGMLMLPQAIASAVFMPIGGRLFDRFGIKPLVVTGMAFIGISAFLLSLISAKDGVGMLILPLVLLGAGIALQGMSLNAYIMQAAPQHLIGRVSSLSGASQQVMASFGIAGLATILTGKLKDHPDSGVQTPNEIWSQAFSETFLVVMAVTIVGIILGFVIDNHKTDEKQNNNET